MKITKLVHSCLLVETAERVALFDPGNFSVAAVEATDISRLDDIFITHQHHDHVDIQLIARLVERFPDVNVIGPEQVVQQLKSTGIATASGQLPDGVTIFNSPHESITPLSNQPEEHGYHYLDKLSHPGDSHSFSETKDILALPVSAPWGSTIGAINLGLSLKPKIIIPIHDWHWSDEARIQMYNMIEEAFIDSGIKFIKTINDQSFELET